MHDPVKISQYPSSTASTRNNYRNYLHEQRMQRIQKQKQNSAIGINETKSDKVLSKINSSKAKGIYNNRKNESLTEQVTEIQVEEDEEDEGRGSILEDEDQDSGTSEKQDDAVRKSAASLYDSLNGEELEEIESDVENVPDAVEPLESSQIAEQNEKLAELSDHNKDNEEKKDTSKLADVLIDETVLEENDFLNSPENVTEDLSIEEQKSDDKIAKENEQFENSVDDTFEKEMGNRVDNIDNNDISIPGIIIDKNEINNSVELSIKKEVNKTGFTNEDLVEITEEGTNSSPDTEDDEENIVSSELDKIKLHKNPDYTEEKTANDASEIIGEVSLGEIVEDTSDKTQMNEIGEGDIDEPVVVDEKTKEIDAINDDSQEETKELDFAHNDELDVVTSQANNDEDLSPAKIRKSEVTEADDNEKFDSKSVASKTEDMDVVNDSLQEETKEMELTDNGESDVIVNQSYDDGDLSPKKIPESEDTEADDNEELDSNSDISTSDSEDTTNNELLTIDSSESDTSAEDIKIANVSELQSNVDDKLDNTIKQEITASDEKNDKEEGIEDANSKEKMPSEDVNKKLYTEIPKLNLDLLKVDMHNTGGKTRWTPRDELYERVAAVRAPLSWRAPDDPFWQNYNERMFKDRKMKRYISRKNDYTENNAGMKNYVGSNADFSSETSDTNIDSPESQRVLLSVERPKAPRKKLSASNFIPNHVLQRKRNFREVAEVYIPEEGKLYVYSYSSSPRLLQVKRVGPGKVVTTDSWDSDPNSSFKLRRRSNGNPMYDRRVIRGSNFSRRRENGDFPQWNPYFGNARSLSRTDWMVEYDFSPHRSKLRERVEARSIMQRESQGMSSLFSKHVGTGTYRNASYARINTTVQTDCQYELLEQPPDQDQAVQTEERKQSSISHSVPSSYKYLQQRGTDASTQVQSTELDFGSNEEFDFVSELVNQTLKEAAEEVKQEEEEEEQKRKIFTEEELASFAKPEEEEGEATADEGSNGETDADSNPTVAPDEENESEEIPAENAKNDETS